MITPAGELPVKVAAVPGQVDATFNCHVFNPDAIGGVSDRKLWQI
jgi:hypothetical protein